MSEKKKELNKVEERLKYLSKCELFLDNIFIEDKTARQILVSAYNKLKRQQKEIEELNKLHYDLGRNFIDLDSKCKQQQKELKDLNEIKQQICNEELITQDYVHDNFIAKDKIREKINYFEHSFDYDDNGESYELVMEVLEELLEED